MSGVVLGRTFGQPLFNIAHSVVTKITDESAEESWQACNRSHVKTILETFYKSKRIACCKRLTHFTVGNNVDLFTADFDDGASR